jgi:membrane fusion protein, multidrug efflux system
MSEMTIMRRRAELLIVILLAVAGCGKSQQGGMGFTMPPAAVTVAPAIERDVPAYLDEIGACTARQYVSIAPQVTGPIMQILFEDGAELHKGDPLFLIDPRPYQATLDQAVATQKQNQAAVDFANIEIDRYKTLLPSQAISQDVYDTKKNALDVATAQLDQAKAAVETAKLNLEYCRITSPIDGRASERLADIGNVVMANQTSLLVIQRIEPIYADFTIAENDLPAVRSHLASGALKVLVKLPSDTGDGSNGDLTFIDTGVQAQAGTVKLRATLPNIDHHFWPGQFINVRLILQVEKNAVLVPESAVQIGQTGSFVYVVGDDSKAQLRPVTVGQRQGDLVVIEKGIKADESVIATGQMMVIPGMPVNVLNAKPAAGGEAGHAPTAEGGGTQAGAQS